MIQSQTKVHEVRQARVQCQDVSLIGEPGEPSHAEVDAFIRLLAGIVRRIVIDSQAKGDGQCEQRSIQEFPLKSNLKAIR